MFSATLPAMRPFSRNTLARLLNLALFLGGCFLAGSGWLIDERLPRGRSGHGLTLFGLDRHAWGEWHGLVGYALVGLVALHLGLHRAWLQKIAATNRAWRLWVGLGLGAIVVLVFVCAPVRTTAS